MKLITEELAQAENDLREWDDCFEHPTPTDQVYTAWAYFLTTCSHPVEDEVIMDSFYLIACGECEGAGCDECNSSGLTKWSQVDLAETYVGGDDSDSSNHV